MEESIGKRESKNCEEKLNGNVLHYKSSRKDIEFKNYRDGEADAGFRNSLA